MKEQRIITLIVFLYLVMVGFQLYRGWSACDGHFIYPLDDTYIHLRMADSMAAHGSWGLNPGEFASASSSLLYTLLLSAITWLFGSHVYWPLVINLISAIGVLFSLNYILRKLSIDPLVITLALLGTIFLVPLLSLSISGMEHSLQILIDLWYWYVCLNYLSGENHPYNSSFRWLCVLSALSVLIRFEGLFLLVIPVIYLFFSRQYSKAFLVTLSAFFPVIVFGTISTILGSYFLPNSLLIKAERPELFSLLGLLEYSVVWIKKLYFTPHLLYLFVLLSACFIWLNLRARNFKSRSYIACFGCLVLFVIHLQFAKTGWFFRYESYLILLTIIALALIDQQVGVILPAHRRTVRVTILVLMIPVFMRGNLAFRETPVAMRNIYDQQYQMAKFINRYYRTAVLGANDVGAISYYNDLRLVDLYGLSSIEVLRLKVKGLHTAGEFERLAKRKGMRIAIIYDDWFVGRVPSSWTKVEKWTIRDNVVCAYDNVSFYAVDASGETELREHLKEFRAELPNRVTVQEMRAVGP